MTPSEIEQLCKETADKFDLPFSSVTQIVKRRAGSSCVRCNGFGVVSGAACFRCNGSGGKATPESVQTALSWVVSNQDEVRLANFTPRARVPDLVKIETWKRDHADLWSYIESMLPGSDQDKWVHTVENGPPGKERTEQLQRIVTRDLNLRRTPLLGVWVDLEVYVQSCTSTQDKWQRDVLKVNFQTEYWKGRFDVLQPTLQARVRNHPKNIPLHVRGKVVWRVEGFLILGDELDIR